MDLQQLDAIRESIRLQLETHLKTPCAPGQDTLKDLNAIELRAALRTVDGIIVQERAALFAPPGATGPVLGGV